MLNSINAKRMSQDGEMPWHFKHGFDIASFKY